MRRNNIILFLLIIFLAMPTFSVLFQTSLFSMHDNAQVQRVYEVHKALFDGMFPVRWSADLGYGYGYPMFNYYAPLVYYLGALFYSIGFSAILSIKVVLVVGIILSGLGMFLLARKTWGTMAGLVASVLYIYLPYHALDMYVRGDFTEAFAYSLMPLLFYILIRVSETLKWQFVIYTSVCYAAIILSHNLTAFMISPFLLIFSAYLIYRQKQQRRQRVFYLLLGLICGLLLSAFYWLPALTEIRYTNVQSVLQGGSDFHSNFVCPSQLWDSPWMYGGSVPGCVDGLSFRIGKLHVIVSIAAFIVSLVVFLLKKSVLERKTIWQMSGIFSGLLFTVYMTLSFSLPIWNSLPFLVYFQFPWRFLLLVGFFSSLAGGFLICLIQNVSKKFIAFKYVHLILAAIIICLSIGIYSKLFIPQYKYFLPDQYYTSHKNLTWNTSKDSDEYLPVGLQKPKSEKEALSYHPLTTNTPIFVKDLIQKTGFMRATVLTPISQNLVLHIASFPAWHTYIDAKEVIYIPIKKGIQIRIPPGLHQIDVVFKQTPIEVASDSISLAGIFLLFAGILWKGYERKIT